MSLSNLAVFNQYAYTTFLEALAYNINLFNAATNGAIVLTSASNQGDYSEEAFYRRISGLIRIRDAYSTADVAAVDINQAINRTVKVASGTPPVNIDPHWWQWIMKSPEEPGALIGKQMAQDTLASMLSIAIKAIVAALTTVGATVVSDATAGTLGLGSLTTGSALYGDRSQDIVAWIIHSKPMFDIWGAALTNAQNLFTYGTVRVLADPMGRPFIVTDQPDLVYTSSGTKYHTLGLSRGAATIEQNPDYIENIETKNGKENIARTFQAQWSYNLGLKGFGWDKDNGGHSPPTAALATGTNWDKVATSIKDLSGIMINSQ